MSSLEILIGVSGSGKSTYAQEHWKKDPKNTVILGRDKIRELLFGYTEATMEDYYNRSDINSLENQVTETLEALIRSNLSKRKHVIVDNTHLKEKYLRYYFKFRVFTAYTFFLDTNLETLKKRVDSRYRKISTKVLTKQINQFNTLIGKYNFYNEVGVKEFNAIHIFNLPLGNFNKIKINRENTKPCVIFDIDGTLAEKGDRSPFDYSKVIEDTPIEHIVELSKILSKHYTIIVCSGREDVCYDDTKAWLDKYGIPYKGLYMRKSKDFRKDFAVKEDMWEEIMNEGYRIEYMVDDRSQVVNHARDLGYPVLQVSQNDF